jgi:hypothetical protein
MAPLVCDTLDATLTGFKEGLGRTSSGEPGGEMSAEQSARLASQEHFNSERGRACVDDEDDISKEQMGRARLSPAGDGAEDVGEACEQQRSSAWWMDVLVGLVRVRDFLRGKLGARERHACRQDPPVIGALSGNPASVCTKLPFTHRRRQRRH